ncbi:ABC transporter ATP-binding protein [Streptomyces sp. NPDC059256]|uniref:ABC transporter ATP-binding protein n=1 Tax=Streptomyces sp. NPDC059256 TaxID=3346794 RepID=UPI003678700E
MTAGTPPPDTAPSTRQGRPIVSLPGAEAPLLSVEDLVAEYHTPQRTVRALDGVDLIVNRGERVGIVGESGSGKSTLGLVIGRLLPAATRYPRGRILVDGESVLDLSAERIALLRRQRLGLIAQDPVGALNPTLRIGRQLRLALRSGRRTARKPSESELGAMLDRVLIHDPERVLRLYPHEISGGMAQRVAVAMVMAREPDLLIADEPTAALDSQVREEVLRLVFSLASEHGTTVLWLSHDLAGVTRWCERTVVMYGGRIVEDGAADEVLTSPRHPYTAALSDTDPARATSGERLRTISGGPPTPDVGLDGCVFAPRCDRATELCRTDRPAPRVVAGRTVACHHPDALAPEAGAPIGSSPIHRAEATR